LLWFQTKKQQKGFWLLHIKLLPQNESESNGRVRSKKKMKKKTKKKETEKKMKRPNDSEFLLACFSASGFAICQCQHGGDHPVAV